MISFALETLLPILLVFWGTGLVAAAVALYSTRHLD